jgi:RHS repeat-associated protein
VSYDSDNNNTGEPVGYSTCDSDHENTSTLQVSSTRTRKKTKAKSASRKSSNREKTASKTKAATKDSPPQPAPLVGHVIQTSGELGNGKLSPASTRLCIRADHVSVTSGEVILEQTDFQLPGPLPLLWRRTYRSSHNQDFGLGAGWSATYLSRLSVDDQKVVYSDGEGRQLSFPNLGAGHGCHNTRELHTLYYDNDNQLRIVKDDGVTLLFRGATNTKRLYAASNSYGQHIQFYYGESGRLTHVIDSAGRLLKLEYTISQRLSSVSVLDNQNQSLGKPLVQYRYNNQGDLTSVVDAAGNVQHFVYQNHVMIRHTNKDGISISFQWDRFDTQGKCKRAWGERDNDGYHFDYNETDNITKVSCAQDHVTEYHYNRFGLISEEINAEGGTTKFEYDDHGRLILQRDPMGNTKHYSYSGSGKLTRMVDSLGHTTRLTYDDSGRLQSLIDALGRRWRRSYDANGRLVSAIDPQGYAVQYHYDRHGNPTIITDAMKRNHRLEWNKKGELLCRMDPAGCREEFQYDHLGRITEVHKHGQVTQYDYDPMGRVTRIGFPDGSDVHMEYSPQGYVTRYVNAQGRATHYRYSSHYNNRYNNLGLPSERINAHGQTFKYEYDVFRNLTAMINENGERYELHYDKNQRLVKESGFDGRIQHYGYDAAGRLVSHTDGDNQITQFKRDAQGQLLKKWSSDQDISRYEYDPLGRLVRAVNNQAELEFKYSDNGQLIEERQNNVRLRHEYDLNNQRSATSINNQRIDYEYNAQGLFKRIAFNGTTLTSITRNAHGLEIARTSGDVSSFFEYDPMGRLIRQRAATEHESIVERSYQYNKSGNLRRIDDFKTGTCVFKYDALDRLQALEGLAPERFSFDPAGNLLDAREAFARSYVKGNRLSVFQDYRFEYDKAGNLVCETKGKKHTRHYYNAQNQLIKTKKDGQTIHYAYDPLGRRITKQNGGNTTAYIWDGHVLISEQRKQLNILYIPEPGGGKPLCQIRDGNIYYYHNDHLGTPLCLTDSAGNIAWEARFKVHGAVVNHHSETIDNNIRFQALYHDPETGLYYHRSRYYHPAVGRFIQQDSIGLAGGENGYQYAPNSAAWVDALGLSATKIYHPGIVTHLPATSRQNILTFSSQAIQMPVHGMFRPNKFMNHELTITHSSAVINAKSNITQTSSLHTHSPQPTTTAFKHHIAEFPDRAS